MWFKQGQIEVDGGDENEFGSGECGDACGVGDAEKINFSGILPNPLHPSPHHIQVYQRQHEIPWSSLHYEHHYQKHFQKP